MYVGLDQSVAVTDADGDHRVDSDAMGGKMTREGERAVMSFRDAATLSKKIIFFVF